MASAVEDGTTGCVCLALDAMATRFELVLDGSNDVDARAAGEEALSEIARLEEHLSFYRAGSDISWINARAASEPVKVEPRLFSLLQRCQALSLATDGAFDITVAPLMRAWRFVGDTGAVPAPALLAAARASVGFRHVSLDPALSSIRFERPGMSIDLGAAAKGYAIDEAVAILRARGITSALLHGGTSSVHVIGAPSNGVGWRIGWHPPHAAQAFTLRDAALSVSAVHGKAFADGGRTYGHVLDPRTGRPTRTAVSAVVTGPGSLEADALSTALLVLGAGWTSSLRIRFPGYDGDVR
ncbi:MAG TPA: FAD:protein FMN transferase [Vicinamibacterales bacterium]|jgi:thiamine biosynthesis lipoprotein